MEYYLKYTSVDGRHRDVATSMCRRRFRSPYVHSQLNDFYYYYTYYVKEYKPPQTLWGKVSWYPSQRCSTMHTCDQTAAASGM